MHLILMHVNYIKLVILEILFILGLCNFKFSFKVLKFLPIPKLEGVHAIYIEIVLLLKLIFVTYYLFSIFLIFQCILQRSSPDEQTFFRNKRTKVCSKLNLLRHSYSCLELPLQKA